VEGETIVQETLFTVQDAPTLAVYTDGGCDPNPGPGGWAAILRYADHEVVLSGNAPHSTNNRMEIEAAIAALAYLQGRHGRCTVDLYTDSRYLRHGITGWIVDWHARGWKTKGGQPVKNQVLWQRLYELAQAHDIQWHWLRGHDGDPFNERADRLATAARVRLSEGADGRAAAPPTTERKGADALLSPASPGTADTIEADVVLTIAVSRRGRRGTGGWAVVIRKGDARRVMRGRSADASSNLLYLQAATAALEALPETQRVTVLAASDYLIQGASEWLPAWQRRGWRTKSGGVVKNREGWEALLAAAGRHQVTWRSTKETPASADPEHARQIAAQEAAGQAGRAS
jgi:ribonuclease HI